MSESPMPDSPDYYEHVFSTVPVFEPGGLFVSEVEVSPPVSKCPQRNNPHGHNPECRCGWAVSDV